MNVEATARRVVGILRSRREARALGLCSLLLSFGLALPRLVPGELKPFLEGWRGLALQAVCLIPASALFVYGAVLLWRLAGAADQPEVKKRPSAIKGPSAFTEEDGVLFSRLGREADLQKLLGHVLDPQTPMIVLMGASGAGKTSLLRAGLTYALAERSVRYHYWEAVPTNSAERLLRAIQVTWGPGAEEVDRRTLPTTLDDLINPQQKVSSQAHVIVIDQAEQLHANDAVFSLLRRVAREAQPPHCITWIVAFRREFRADWSDFIVPEQDNGFYPRELSLRLFSPSQARKVVGQILDEAHLSIERAVVDNLVDAASVDGEVSPVDIGIGVLVLSALHERQAGESLTVADYRFAGGAEGLLTQYVQRCLEAFPDWEREILLRALLALRDPGTEQRLADGQTAATLAAKLGVSSERLGQRLNRLAQSDMRLVELVGVHDPVRYRLPHERLIPALRVSPRPTPSRRG